MPSIVRNETERSKIGVSINFLNDLWLAAMYTTNLKAYTNSFMISFNINLFYGLSNLNKQLAFTPPLYVIKAKNTDPQTHLQHNTMYILQSWRVALCKDDEFPLCFQGVVFRR